MAIASDNAIGQVANPDLDNEEFSPVFLKYDSPTKVGSGLQSTHYFKQIIRERKISKYLGPDTIVCSTISILLDSGLDQAKWSNGASGKTLSATSPGQYYYYWRDCGVLYTDTINIFFEEEITETKESNHIFCEGDSIVLIVPSLEYIWNTGIQGDQLKVKDEGVYFSTYKEGCLTNINIFNVAVDTLLNLPDLKDTSYCNQSEFKLNLPKPYEIYDALNVKIPDDKLVNLNGSFLISAQNTCGKFEQKITIKVDTFPNIPLDSYFMCSTLDFPLELSTDVGETFWNETFQSKNFVITEPGIYKYEVNNNCGEFKGTVSVALDEVTTLPNIFSPNGDSVNDNFPGIELKSFFNVIIFDRWGNLVWEGSKDWDGTHKSGSVANGVYTYILKSLACERQLVGTITVIK